MTNKIFKCPYCPQKVGSEQGLRSHLSQNLRCKARLHKSVFAKVIRNSRARARARANENESSEQEEDGGGDEEDVEMDDVADDLSDNFDPVPAPVVDDAADGNYSRRTTIEEVEDEDDIGQSMNGTGNRWIHDFPHPAGIAINEGDGEKLSEKFEKIREGQRMAGEAPWAPFTSQDEWEVARWLVKAGVSQAKIDEFLKLHKVRTKFQTP